MARPRKQFDIKTAIKLYTGGFSLSDVAKDMHISRQTLSKVLKSAGIDVRGKGAPSMEVLESRGNVMDEIDDGAPIGETLCAACMEKVHVIPRHDCEGARFGICYECLDECLVYDEDHCNDVCAGD